MIPEVISHYRVIRQLGAGGMGVVYLAEDSRLGRHVAIKVLPERFTGHTERLRRFEQEARAASALNHPNIITIYDTGQVDESRFIVTEWIEGETLRQRIGAGRLGVHETLRIATQIAEALAAAHRVGVVHRDIKPENIMIRRDGYVKVLDFGLAKLTETHSQPISNESPTMARIDTTPGVVMGTVSYMSPEQARGLAVDAPSDIFSLGVVMYEMLAGRLPFSGATPTDVVVSILQAEPAPLTAIAPDVPSELERIVNKTMAKDRHERHETADDLAGDLRRLKQRLEVAAEVRQARSGSGDVAPGPQVVTAPDIVTGRATEVPLRHRRLPIALIIAFLAAAIAIGVSVRNSSSRREAITTLAVLPFANASSDPNGEYLSDGITESLINDLAELPDLKVMSRNAVWRYKGKVPSADPRSVGNDLRVRAVLMGRVSHRGDRVSVSAELIDVRDNSQIWGEQYDRATSEVLPVQRDIAARIVENLRVKLSGNEQRLLAKQHTENSEAYERYLRGRYHLNRRSADAIRKGRQFFQQAIEIDPAYALAYSGVSDSYALLAAQGAMSPTEAYPSALVAARKAIELDPQLAEGHASLAHAAFHVGDHDVAAREFARAVALKPNYLPAYQWQAEYLNAKGRRDDAVALTRKALSIDPLDLATNAQLASLMIANREYDEAEKQLKKTLDIDPEYFLAHSHLGNVYLLTERYPEAIAEFETTARLTGGARGLSWLVVANARSGRRVEAERVLASIEARARQQYVDPMDRARAHASLLNRAETLRWLRVARDDRNRPLTGVKNDDEFAFLRSDPEFARLTGDVK